MQKQLYKISYLNPYIGQDHTVKTLYCRSSDQSAINIHTYLFGNSLARKVIGLDVGDSFREIIEITSNEIIGNVTEYDVEDIKAQVEQLVMKHIET